MQIDSHLKDYKTLGYNKIKEQISFEDYFECDRIIQEIGSKQKIILQFPVEALGIAIQVQNNLRKKLSKEQNLFIVSDQYFISNKYKSLKNNCCVDIVGAQHIQAEIIIHFGYPCFSEEIENQLIKIIHILPKLKINVQEYNQKLEEFISQNKNNTMILPDLEYLYLQQQLMEQLQNNQSVIFCGIYEKNSLENFLFYGYYTRSEIDKIIKKDLIIISEKQDPFILEKIYFIKDHYNIENIYTYNPLNNLIQPIDLNINQSILKRLSLIEKAKDCQCFGLLILNPNTEFCQVVLSKLRELLKSQNKKFFCFVMNCINEVKLNNFPEIDCYVCISCHNCCLIDYKKFYKLIISPYELMISLKKDFFPLYFVLDAKGLQFDEIQIPIQKQLEEQQTSLMPLNQDNQVIVAELFQTLDHFQTRRFQGLDIDQGDLKKIINLEKEVTLAQQGLKGIAQQYENELQKK